MLTVNYDRLAESVRDIESGRTIEEIELHKLYDDRYATNMPYQDGFAYIEVWMKNYYELPYEVRFVWRNAGT